MWLELASDSFRTDVWPGLDGEVRGRLERYAADLLHFNRAQNLISRRDPERQLAELLEESVVAGLRLARRGLCGPAWADVGTGAGFPGLALGALFPEQTLVLIERRQGRADFLLRQVRALELPSVEIWCGDARVWPGEPFELVLAKAVAAPGEIELLCAGVVAPEGVLAVFGRGRDRAGAGWRQAWSESLPGKDAVLRGLVRD